MPIELASMICSKKHLSLGVVRVHILWQYQRALVLSPLKPTLWLVVHTPVCIQELYTRAAASCCCAHPRSVDPAKGARDFFCIFIQTRQKTQHYISPSTRRPIFADTICIPLAHSRVPSHRIPSKNADGTRLTAAKAYRACRSRSIWHSSSIRTRACPSRGQPGSCVAAWSFPSSLAPAVCTNPRTEPTRGWEKDWCGCACAF